MQRGFVGEIQNESGSHDFPHTVGMLKQLR